MATIDQQATGADLQALANVEDHDTRATFDAQASETLLRGFLSAARCVGAA
jgi:hypothetical protein